MNETRVRRETSILHPGVQFEVFKLKDNKVSLSVEIGSLQGEGCLHRIGKVLRGERTQNRGVTPLSSGRVTLHVHKGFDTIFSNE